MIHIKCCNEDLEPCSFFNRSRSIQLMQQTFTSENHYANHSSLRLKVSKCKCDRSSSISKESHHRTSDIWKYDHKIHKETRRMDGWHLRTSIFATRKLAQSTHDLILHSRWNKGQMWDRTRSDCNMLRSWGKVHVATKYAIHISHSHSHSRHWHKHFSNKFNKLDNGVVTIELENGPPGQPVFLIVFPATEAPYAASNGLDAGQCRRTGRFLHLQLYNVFLIFVNIDMS